MQEAKGNDILLTNIQRFSLHDGPGIRTTVFLKGCSLCCPWCCNPENIVKEKQAYRKGEKKGIYGIWFSCETLYQELIKDRVFYRGKLANDGWNITKASQLADLPGGVTFSGGEPLLQITELLPLLQRLKRESIHVAVETALFVPEENVRMALETVDLIYIDLKIVDKTRCANVVCGNLSQYLKNLDWVLRWTDREGRRKPVVVRIPLIGGYTDSTENKRKIGELLSRYIAEGFAPLKIELMKGHNLGFEKYRSLGLAPPQFEEVPNERLESFQTSLEQIGIPVEMLRL